MHMADALLSPAVGMVMNAVSATAIGVSAARLRKQGFSEKTVPVMGVAAAVAFAGQMVNFAIPLTGSSGHIVGGVMLAGLLGGVPAFLAMAAVLIIQCLFFADGGLLALGCNIFNMGFIPCLIIYPLVFKPLLGSVIGYRRLTVASLVSSTAAIELAALAVVIQTMLSGISALPFSTFALLMLPIHLAIGLVEGAVTAGVLCFVYRMRPELIEAAQGGGGVGRGVGDAPLGKAIAVLAALALVAGGAFSLLASTQPDGLEWALGRASELSPGNGDGPEVEGGIHDAAADLQDKTAVLPDYSLQSDVDNPAGTSLSGIVGAVATFAVAGATGLVITKLRRRRGTEVEADA